MLPYSRERVQGARNRLNLTVGEGNIASATTAHPGAPARTKARFVLVTTSGPTAEDAFHLRLDGSTEAAGDARRALARLRGDIDPPVLETLRLLVTELIANSVKHTDAQDVDLKVLVGRNSVVTEVTDPGPGFEPIERAPDQDPASGWGLFLVDRLADRWGVKREPDGTRVWFELKRG
jgi:anti-sigma regulatory factor (Ser/Thr protein kinase)